MMIYQWPLLSDNQINKDNIDTNMEYQIYFNTYVISQLAGWNSRFSFPRKFICWGYYHPKFLEIKIIK